MRASSTRALRWGSFPCVMSQRWWDIRNPFLLGIGLFMGVMQGLGGIKDLFRIVSFWVVDQTGTSLSTLVDQAHVVNSYTPVWWCCQAHWEIRDTIDVNLAPYYMPLYIEDQQLKLLKRVNNFASITMPILQVHGLESSVSFESVNSDMYVIFCKFVMKPTNAQKYAEKSNNMIICDVLLCQP